MISMYVKMERRQGRGRMEEFLPEGSVSIAVDNPNSCFECTMRRQENFYGKAS